ncbi:thiol-disulfide oxidoreductase DCC family protein [Priestia megaterium]|uniref:thiol-disulfide oxidoreductase DCC family protein n=1 Tax=Priestia megaterium TaxID=1404 RepID=UPI001867DFAC|nr:DUF393 domain-containing protein [Priestia megaterium]MBE2977102.1 DUF393 domain-containing protein [Priestia megaterium]
MKHKVFFDAECPLCYNVKKIIKALDWTKQIQWIPVQYIERTEYSYLKEEGRDLYDQIHMVTKKGKVLAGFETVRRLLAVLPLTFPIGVLLHLPLMKKAFSPLYKWISTNRYDWFGRYDSPRTT